MTVLTNAFFAGSAESGSTWSYLITGEQPDARRAEPILRLLLRD
jgi:hypothetical protein